MPCEINVIPGIPASLSTPAAGDLVIFTLADGTSVVRTWATISGAFTPADAEWLAGGGVVAIGVATFTDSASVGRRVRLFRGGIKQQTTAVAGGYYYAHNNATGVFTVTPVPSAEEVFQREIY